MSFLTHFSADRLLVLGEDLEELLLVDLAHHVLHEGRRGADGTCTDGQTLSRAPFSTRRFSYLARNRVVDDFEHSRDLVARDTLRRPRLPPKRRRTARQLIDHSIGRWVVCNAP